MGIESGSHDGRKKPFKSEYKETDYDSPTPKDGSNPFVNIMEELKLSYLTAVGKLEEFESEANEDKGTKCKKKSSFKSKLKTNRDNIPKEDMEMVTKLLKQQSEAISYKQWHETSVKLDEVLGNNEWKSIKDSDLYDYKLVEKQLNELKAARLNKDYYRMLYIIRTTWRRNFAGIDNTKLYGMCYVGTKVLIEEYLSECEKCLRELSKPDCPLNDNHTLEMLTQTRRNYGQIAITMSGGGTFGLTGIGVFAALFENSIFPKMVSGSSCGSIMSTAVCALHDNEILDLLSHLFTDKFEVFGSEDDPQSIIGSLNRFLKYGVLFDNLGLQGTVKSLFGDITFREAFNKTGRILNITVSPASIHDQPTLLNYLTAPHVMIWSAICASCSVPLIFPSSTIYEKDIKTGEQKEWCNPMVKFVDGSVNGDLPITRLSEMFNVNHVIASQVNPHILPLVRFSMECEQPRRRNSLGLMFKRLVKKTFKVTCWEISHYLDVLTEIGIFPNISTKLKQLITQPYSGDITILPEIKLDSLSSLFANPTADFFWNCIIGGARATWPQIEMIKDHCMIEFALDKAITTLRSRIITRGDTTAPKQLTLLDCKNIEIEEHDFEGPRERRESMFRERSGSLSCYHFSGESTTPYERRPSTSSMSGLNQRSPFENALFSRGPTFISPRTPVRYSPTKGRSSRKIYSSFSSNSLHTAYRRSLEIGTSFGSTSHTRRHSAEIGKITGSDENDYRDIFK
ncbi:hypothetical protein HII12_002323 [Brettanomyces bruxellensis]|uniref:Patatin-like phospholipase domain-containing protein n=1 Tax=Dekkera bruxellensis TaxID=5007 RepID=A0A8H6EWG1_DEKBR|nr:hypothetical protein HII12_002323 [Brettanomyces bruxellensis]